MEKRKRIYLKELIDLTDEEEKNIITKLLMNNSEFERVVFEHVSQEYYDMQEEDGNLTLGSNWHEYIDIRDNYNSFYLRLKDYNKFFHNLDRDYLCQDGIDLYDKTEKLFKERDNMIVDTIESEDRFEELEDMIEKNCIELLEIVENQLHDYEKIDNNDLENWLFDNINDNNLFNELYYYEDDINMKLYEDISYTKEWC